MKEFIIKLLSGYTKKEFTEKLNIELNKYRKNLFRKGDLVYINNKNYNPTIKYYLLESYNNGFCWYVSLDENDSTRRELFNGVVIDDIQFEKIEVCCQCGSSI